jgi:hypothetical protein
VIRPQFSMAPTERQARPTRSSFARQYGSPKNSLKIWMHFTAVSTANTPSVARLVGQWTETLVAPAIRWVAVYWPATRHSR